MSLVLVRVDDRLLHGQVVIGWGSRLNPGGYLVVDDMLAQSEWEQDLYRVGLPEGRAARFVAVDEAARALGEVSQAPDRWIVLFRDVATAVRAARTGALAGIPLNLGGIHSHPGEVVLLPFLRLERADVAGLEELRSLGIDVSARETPDSQPVPLDTLLP